MRSFTITNGFSTKKISVKTKDLDDCPDQLELVRKIFRNELIIGATLNYSNGQIVRIDLENQ